jgi:RNA polymerase sigma-70 factor (ECF subfamily)
MSTPCNTPTEAGHVAGNDLLRKLRGSPLERDDAAAELHALLLRGARFEIGRRSAALGHVRGESAGDLALQAADDAFVAVMSKLDDFRGEARFTTWAYKFALYEAAVRVRRRAWQHREVVLEPDSWLSIGEHGAGPSEQAQQSELLAAIRRLIDTRLTPRQREVLVALTIQGIPIDVLAERLSTTRGALYKTLHDARRKLRSELADAGHDLGGITA